ncbi:TrkH family potassium uptake protein [Desulfosporosinus nitroreducens]|uniref:TrkH family potassium uptake protein n=1 Tax=Desulfosporosinus nitroreducens TaxID=2018668 RepID=A0ABT8QVY9_9FIRM|nr:TrkH family potassium uptake protein [Desulfosporosinus nitroreducens]MCO1602314.1 TrkH family potassium uptake protein [Desulfosporosinus nitroreducens]MDO0824744.1 TrkH family potassium uptake protein [Desulfosporosinus nitroreducens]
MNALGKIMSPSRVLVLGFALLILFGAILLTLPQATQDGLGLSILNAAFTATSAVCVTGLVVVDTATTFTLFGQWVILFLIQVGGLGFMTFATLFAMILGKKITLKERLLLQEALNQVSVEGIVRLTKSVLLISFAFEAMGTLILTIHWYSDFGFSKALYYGFFHSISAFNNAGFDIMGNFTSLTAFVGDPVVNMTIMILFICGGLGFIVMADLLAHRKKFRLHTKIVLLVSGVLILLGTVIVLIMEFANPDTLGPLPLGTKVMAALFQSATTRTAGFNTINIAGMYDTTLLSMIVLMFIGASPGGTGGGIKTTTFIAIALSVLSTYRSDPQVVFKGRTLPRDVIQKAWAVTTSALFLVFIILSILSHTENSDLMTVFFEVTSAFGTVGLSLGITPTLSEVGKMAIILTMFIGRLGPLTLAFVLSQKKNKQAAHIKYPDERIMIG